MVLAERFFKETGKKTRFYVGDQSKEMIQAAGLVEDGIAEICQFTDRDEPLSTTQFISDGYWPQDVDDPKSKLIAPDMAKVRDLYAMWVYEGLSVFGTYIMGSIKGGLAERAGRGEKIGQDSPIQIQDPESKLRFGGNAPAHYNVAQNHIINCLLRSKALPGMVLWTAHERASEDKENGNERIIGPDAAGKALTAKLPLWFGNTIHLTTATKRVKAKDPITLKDIDTFQMERRAYLMDHCDPDGLTAVKYVANTRCPLVKDAKGKIINPLPEYIAPPDPIDFYKRIADARSQRRKQNEVSAEASFVSKT